MADTTFTPFEKCLVWKWVKCVGNYWILYCKQINKPWLLYSVVKHLESGRDSRSREKHSTTTFVFPYTLFVLYCLLPALQQNRVQLGLCELKAFCMIVQVEWGISRGNLVVRALAFHHRGLGLNPWRWHHTYILVPRVFVWVLLFC